MGLEPYPESVIFGDLWDCVRTNRDTGEGAGAHENMVNLNPCTAGMEPGGDNRHAYSEAELEARRRLFEQCQAMIFEDCDPNLLR